MDTKTSALLSICVGLIITTGYYMVKYTSSYNQESMEKAYFEGQKDALTNDVRIKRTVDGCWIWTRSCWNSGKTPQFNPSIVCGK